MVSSPYSWTSPSFLAPLGALDAGGCNEMITNDSDAEPFDPLSEDRAGDADTHVTLRQRGKVIQQLRETLRRRQSYSTLSRRVSTELLSRKSTTRTLRRVGEPSADGGDADGFAAPHEDPDSAGSDSVSLITSAVLALWCNYRTATGFRQWREATRGPTDVSKLGNDVDLSEEARRILMLAETQRQSMLQASSTSSTRVAPHDDPTSHLSPRAMPDTTGIRLSRAELDLLLVWARQLQSKTFRTVDDASICEAMRCLRYRHYQDGDALFYEGEAGDTFYIIVQGTVAVFVGMSGPVKAALASGEKTKKRIDWPQLGKRVYTYRTGDSFGETAVLSNDATRTASAVAVGPCEVCALHRDVYRRTLRKYHQHFFESAQKINFLQRVALFRDLPRHKLTALAEVVDKKRFDFGDSLLTEKSSSVYACYLVLSGAVKLTQSIEIPGPPQNPLLNPSGCSSPIKRKKPVASMNMELQTVVSNEIVALEALLIPLGATAKASYTATISSAHADIYVLRESDARAFIGGVQSALGFKIRQICDADAAYRERRRLRALETLHANSQDAVDALESAKPQKPTVQQPEEADSLDLAAALPASPRSEKRTVTDESRSTVTTNVPGLATTRPPPISEGTAPYLPNLRPTHLFPGSSLLFPRSAMSALAPSSDLSVVSSPKMLSSCVRKFLFANSDTLACDYVERLSHQFPVPMPPPPVKTYETMNKTQRDEHRVLEQQLAKMHDNKMHGDPKQRGFVVSSQKAKSGCQTARASDPPYATGTRPPTGSAQTSILVRSKKSTFHQELRATQQVARKLMENHLRRVGQKQPVTSAGEGTFLHLFAD